MNGKINIALDAADVWQILDGLEVREAAWRKTQSYLEKGDTGDEFFLIEECSNSDEAGNIADTYQRIISELRNQLNAQRPP